jgi:hypothetical protein
LHPYTVRATSLNLGAASGYAVFALGSFQYNGPGSITGNVAVGQSTNFATPATINGTLYLNLGVTENGNVVPTGGTQNVDLSNAIAAAQAAPAQYNALPATQSFGTLGNNSSINGNGGINVVDVSGITLTNGVLTLNGGANDYFIINDSGDFTFSNSDMALSGGVLASHVLLNIGGNTTISGGGPTNFYGTFLDPNGSITVHDDNLTGELIGKTVSDTSGFQISNTPFTPTPTVPEPGTCFSTLGALLGVGALMKRRLAAK